MKESTHTMFAIVGPDNSTEYVKTLKSKYKKTFCFCSMEIPHKGKRYKSYARALAMAEKINRENENPCNVIETLI